MSRPLTGRLIANQAGTFTAEIPVARGSAKRRRATFTPKAAAERWRDAGIRALRKGRPIPEPDAKHLSSITSAAPSRIRRGTRFKAIGEDWIRERYVEDGHGDIGREQQVRGFIEVIDAHMDTNALSVETMTRQDARTMFRRLLKNPSSAHIEFPAGEDAEALVTRMEALAFLETHGCPVSRSSITRAVRRGTLRHASTRGAAHLYRSGDLFDPAAGLTTRRGGDAGRYGHATLGDVRRTFRAVMKHAKGQGIRLQPGVRDAKLPKNRQRKARTRALTLPETARLAGRLHVVHQLALMLLRILGLRISEGYGLLVEDVLDCGPGVPGLLTVQSQGGRKWGRRQGDGTIDVTDHVDDVKADSWRLLVVPAPLMDLIRVVIDVFHTDSDGTVDPKARLIPGLETANVGGQSTFRAALAAAASAEGLSVEVDGGRASANQRTLITPTPHHLRKSFATALGATQEKIEHIRAALGHHRGEEVIHLHYLVEDPELKPQRAIAEAMSTQIADALPHGLMVPTAKRCTTHNQSALADRAAEIDARLADIGWLTHHRPEGDWLTVSDAAATRGVTPAQIRSDIRSGRLPAIEVTRSDQEGKQYLVATADVLAMADRLGTGSELRQLAEELDVAYDTVRHYVVRHPDLTWESNGGRDYRVTEDVADAIRAYFLAQRSLSERARRMPEVANELGVSVAAVDTHIRHGRLVEDDRFHGGVRSITKASLEGLRHRGRGFRRRQTRIAPTPVATAA